jgi:toxin ParE1/3/4
MWPDRGFDKHLIFYRETDEGLEIVRILHTARDINALFGEED